MKQRMLTTFAALLALLLCLCPLMGLTAEKTLPPLHVLNLGDYDEADVAVILEDLEAYAGLTPYRSLPTEYQIQFLDALALSNAALMAHTGMSEAKLRELSVLPYFCVGEDTLCLDGQQIVMRDPRWLMHYAGYSVYLDATTGEVLAIEGPGDGNG